MTHSLFLYGCLIGFSVAAPPVGGIGILCIRRSLRHGFLIGLLTGIGSATADTLFALGAVMGLSALVHESSPWVRILSICGALLMAYLGIKIFRSTPKNAGHENEKTPSLLSAYLSTFVLTITNPVAVLSFAAFFSAFGAPTSSSLLIPLGVFCGATLWWIILSGAVSRFRDRVSTRMLRWVNIVCGSVLIILSAASILRLFLK